MVISVGGPPVERHCHTETSGPRSSPARSWLFQAPRVTHIPSLGRPQQLPGSGNDTGCARTPGPHAPHRTGPEKTPEPRGRGEGSYLSRLLPGHASPRAGGAGSRGERAGSPAGPRRGQRSLQTGTARCCPEVREGTNEWTRPAVATRGWVPGPSTWALCRGSLLPHQRGPHQRG